MSSVLNGLSCFEEAPALDRTGPAFEAFHDEDVKVAVGEDERPREDETLRARSIGADSISRFSGKSTAESILTWRASVFVD